MPWATRRTSPSTTAACCCTSRTRWRALSASPTTTNLNLVQTTDAAGQLYTNSYDAQATCQLDRPAGHTVSFTLHRHVQPAGLGHRRQRQHHPLRLRRQGQPDLDDLRRRHRGERGLRPGGQRAEHDQPPRPGHPFTYDAAGNVLTKTFPDGSQVDLHLRRPRNLTSATDATGTTTLTYDANDRLTQITYPSGRWLEFTYDAAGPAHADGRPDRLHGQLRLRRRGRLATLTDGSGDLIVQLHLRRRRPAGPQGQRQRHLHDLRLRCGRQLLHLVNYAPTARSSRGSTTPTTAWPPHHDGDARRHLDLQLRRDRPVDPRRVRLDQPGDSRPGPDLCLRRGWATASADDHQRRDDRYTTNNMNQYTQVGDTHLRYDADGNLISATDASGTTTYTLQRREPPDRRQRRIERLVAYRYDALGNRVATTENGATTQLRDRPDRPGQRRRRVRCRRQSDCPLRLRLRPCLTELTPPAAPAYYAFDAIGNTSSLDELRWRGCQLVCLRPVRHLAREVGSGRQSVSVRRGVRRDERGAMAWSSCGRGSYSPN